MPRPRTAPLCLCLCLGLALLVGACASSKGASRTKVPGQRLRTGELIHVQPSPTLRSAFGPEADLGLFEPGFDPVLLARRPSGQVDHWPLPERDWLWVRFGMGTDFEREKLGYTGGTLALIASLRGDIDPDDWTPERIAKAAGLELGDFVGSAVLRREPPTTEGPWPRGEVMPRVYSTSRDDTFVLDDYGLARCRVVDVGAYSGGRKPFGIRFTHNVHWQNAVDSEIDEGDFEGAEDQLEWIAENSDPGTELAAFVDDARQRIAGLVSERAREAAEVAAQWPGQLAAHDSIDAARDPWGRERAAALEQLEAALELAHEGGVTSAQSDLMGRREALFGLGATWAARTEGPFVPRLAWHSILRAAEQGDRVDSATLARVLSLDFQPGELVGWRAAKEAFYSVSTGGWDEVWNARISEHIASAAERASERHEAAGDEASEWLERLLARQEREAAGKHFARPDEIERMEQLLAAFPTGGDVDRIVAWIEEARTEPSTWSHPAWAFQRNTWLRVTSERMRQAVPEVEARMTELEDAGYVALPLVLRDRFLGSFTSNRNALRPVDELARTRRFESVPAVTQAVARAVVLLDPPLRTDELSGAHVGVRLDAARWSRRGLTRDFGALVESVESLQAAAEELGLDGESVASVRVDAYGQENERWRIELRPRDGMLASIDTIGMRATTEALRFGTSQEYRDKRAELDAAQAAIDASRETLADRRSEYQVDERKAELLDEVAAAQQLVAEGRATQSYVDGILRNQREERDSVNVRVGVINNLVDRENEAVREFNRVVRELNGIVMRDRHAGQWRDARLADDALTDWYERRMEEIRSSLAAAGEPSDRIAEEIELCRYLCGLDEDRPAGLEGHPVSMSWPARMAERYLAEAAIATSAGQSADRLSQAWIVLGEDPILKLDDRFQTVADAFQTHGRLWSSGLGIYPMHDYDSPSEELPYVRRLVDLGTIESN